MFANAAVQVRVVFSDVAKHALDPDTDNSDAIVPASFMARAQYAMPGDLVQLPGAQGLFIVSQRIWDLRSGAATLQLVLDVLVQDND
jgi:hypothetical protein